MDRGYDQSRIGVPLADYPLILDLDTNGEVGIVVADSGAMPPGGRYRGVRMIEGRTGATRWRRPMRPQTAGKDGVAQIMASPDLDGDGMRDLVAVSLFDGKNRAGNVSAGAGGAAPGLRRRDFEQRRSALSGGAKSTYPRWARPGYGSPRGGDLDGMAGPCSRFRWVDHPSKGYRNRCSSTYRFRPTFTWSKRPRGKRCIA